MPKFRIFVLCFFASTASVSAVFAQEITQTVEKPNEIPEEKTISGFKKWQVLVDSHSLYKGGPSLELGSILDRKLNLGLLLTQMNIEGYKSVQKPTEMVFASLRYFPNRSEVGGWYFGGGMSYVRTIQQEDSFGNPIQSKSERFAQLFVGGYEIYSQLFSTAITLRAGLGYGPGSPYIGKINANFMGGLLEYAYLDAGAGIRF